MNNPIFLYGASVQGIQGFIFQTNALREIVGASELVEQICTSLFAMNIDKTEEELKTDPNAIVTAAGNIKYVFSSEEKCKNLVLTFPRNVMEFAPGITISQAVVEVKGEIQKEHIDELERLLRIQRNKPLRPYDLGLMAMNRSRRTGLPAVEEKRIRRELTVIDSGTKAKVEIKSERVLTSMLGEISDKQIPWELEDITRTKKDNYSWLAVVHADGNNMGMALQQLADAMKDEKGDEYIRSFRNFSLALDESTKEAASKAFNEVYKIVPGEKVPFRPIVLGGDDLTVICRGDLALDFTKHFLEYFKTATKKHLSSLKSKLEIVAEGFTACAGIAYIKESYPFHYGYQLAETLCREAKKAAKEGNPAGKATPSCLMFHKVQDSFVEDFTTIRERELKSGDIDFCFGPYYLESTGKKPTIEGLACSVSQLEGKEGNAIKSHLRQWLTDLHNDPGLAKQKLDRLLSTIPASGNLGLPKSATEGGKSPVYDWLTIHSINQGGK